MPVILYSVIIFSVSPFFCHYQHNPSFTSPLSFFFHWTLSPSVLLTKAAHSSQLVSCINPAHSHSFSLLLTSSCNLSPSVSGIWSWAFGGDTWTRKCNVTKGNLVSLKTARWSLKARITSFFLTVLAVSMKQHLLLFSLWLKNLSERVVVCFLLEKLPDKLLSLPHEGFLCSTAVFRVGTSSWSAPLLRVSRKDTWAFSVWVLPARSSLSLVEVTSLKAHWDKLVISDL